MDRAGAGGNEGERSDPRGVMEADVLRDHASHADAHDVGLGPFQVVHQEGGVVGELGHGVRLAVIRASSHARMVVPTDATVGRQPGHQGLPRDPGHAEPHDQQDGRAVGRAGQAVMAPERGEVGERHDPLQFLK